MTPSGANRLRNIVPTTTHETKNGRIVAVWMMPLNQRTRTSLSSRARTIADGNPIASFSELMIREFQSAEMKKGLSNAVRKLSRPTHSLFRTPRTGE